MTTEQKLPEWWDKFCEAVQTRTLHHYECRANHWAEDTPWRTMIDMAGTIYQDPSNWQFRKKQRTVNIDGVELVAPVLAGDVMPRDRPVYGIHCIHPIQAYHLTNGLPVFDTESDCIAMRAALLGVKP